MMHGNYAAPSAATGGPSNHQDDLPPLPQSRLSIPNPPEQDLSVAEMVHKDALAAAQVEHDRVREAAILAIELHRLKEEQQMIRDREGRLRQVEKEQKELENRLRELEQKERERQRKESELTKSEARLRELQTANVKPTPPTQNYNPSRVESSQNTQTPPIRNSANHQTTPIQKSPPSYKAALSKANTTLESTAPQVQQASAPAQIPRWADHRPQNLQSVTAQTQPHAKPVPVSQQPTNRATARYVLPGTQQYLEIHSRLKKLRTFMTDEAKRNSELKNKVGEMRREIRKSVGQLTEGRGANKQPINSIINTLKEALNQIPSPLVDPSMATLSRPEPLHGAINNSDRLPVLFLYLLNIFAKAVVSQFIDEAGVSSKAADPIGVVAVSIFGQTDLCWRGMSLIDILICKMRVSCPVLFGIRGSEKTEEGRARLGWKRGESGDWIIEQVHNTRMTGLGAGYAAISLRDFTKSPHKNPFPPSMYWQTIALIVNTPPEETTSTHYTVLKALIENYEQRFMNFYGHAARASLQVALVDFPARAPEKTVAVSSLMVLGDKLERDAGLMLKPPSTERAKGFDEQF